MRQPTVFLVEDDQTVRESVALLLSHQGILVEDYAMPSEVLRAFDPTKPGCLVIGLNLPEMTGLELRGRLVKRGCHIPFIVIAGHGSVHDVAKAMRMGAVDVIEKPFSPDILLNRVWQAINEDKKRRREQARHDRIQARIAALSHREREVLALIIKGKLTKQIARQLGISVKTVEAHRSNILKKTKVSSSIQLVRLVGEEM